jgi:RHS repeat-associated protein
VSATYGYDKSGDTTTRPNGTDTQSLTWNATGGLDTVTEKSSTGTTKSTTSHVYDADGNLLIRRNTGGETVLYLGTTEVHLDTSTSTARYWAQRYYGAGSAIIALRTNKSGTQTLSYLSGDPHGTSTVSLDATTQAVTKRYLTPFGAARPGGTGVWADDKTFLDKTTDATSGLTYIGAREYDSATGRFLSVDPVLDTGDAQSLNGYTYADNSPVTLSDPTGLCPEIDCPTRSGPGYENTTPGHTPKKPKKTGTGTSSSDSQGNVTGNGSWISATTPSSNDARSVGSSYYQFGSNKLNSTAGGYWFPQTNAFGKSETVCFGRLACNHAYEYYLDHRDDVAGAKKIAATYCLSHAAQCRNDARVWERTQELGNEFVTNLAAGEGVRAGESPTTCSFSPETPVLMDGGKTKPIGKIKMGDRVQAADPKTGKHEGARTVQHVWINHDNDLLDVTIRTEDGHTATLHTTANHPFWDDTRHTWVSADELHKGDALNTATNHQTYVIVTRPTPGSANRWNLTVQQLHTYYVLAGSTPVLVHNSSSCPRVIGNDPDYQRVAASEGGQYFEVPLKHWDKLTEEEQWAANEKFLDRGIAQGATFRLATPIDEMKEGSAYAREINYLFSNGYTFNRSGDGLISGK